MKIPGGNSILPYSNVVQKYKSASSPVKAGTKTSAAKRFDQVTISGADTGQNHFAMQLKSKISQEVQTATTTGALAALRQEIEAGTYEPDPSAIARKMLFFEEA